MHSIWDSWEVSISGILRGNFDSSGPPPPPPTIRFGICKDIDDLPSEEFTGLIDTGFTGFIQIPLQIALNLDLRIQGTTRVTIADNTRVNVRTALALATLGESPKSGVIHISETLPVILLGMDFLRSFRKALIVSKSMGVCFLDEDLIERQIERNFPNIPV